MISIKIRGLEFFDELNEEFIVLPESTLNLEHSLVSVSKWEAKWHKPFLDDRQQKTSEEIIDYIRCMTINKSVDPMVYESLKYDPEAQKKINEYIENPMTATTITTRKQGGPSQIVTSELIYYWMIQFGIPVEFEKWHLSRLMTLIQVCSIKNDGGGKKMSNAEILRQNQALNAQRRAKYGTKG